MQIAIGLYPEFTALDAIGPYQVLTQVPGVDVVLCAAQTGRLSDDNGLLHFDIEHTFADVPTPDMLLVPGGFVTRKLARDRPRPDRRVDRIRPRAHDLHDLGVHRRPGAGRGRPARRPRRHDALVRLRRARKLRRPAH